jgi:thioesterase domain-containing protein
MFDTFVPRRTSAPTDISPPDLLFEIAGKPNNLDLTAMRAMSMEHLLEFWVVRGLEAQRLPPGYTVAHARGVLGAICNNELASRQYQPPDYSGDVLLFRSENNHSPLKALGWEHYVQGHLSVIPVSGEHTKMLSKNYVEQYKAPIMTALAGASKANRVG